MISGTQQSQEQDVLWIQYGSTSNKTGNKMEQTATLDKLNL